MFESTHSESWEKPSKTAEDERFDKTDDVEKLPTLNAFDAVGIVHKYCRMNSSKEECLLHIRHYLNIDAVDGKEDGDGAVDRHWQGEHKEPATISERHIAMSITCTKLFLP